MNWDQLSGIVRVVVPAICTWLAAKGFSWLGDEGVEAEIGAVVVGVIAIVWSYLHHSEANKLKAAAKIDPTIRIEVPNHIVNSSPAIAQLVDSSSIHNVVRERVSSPPGV